MEAPTETSERGKNIDSIISQIDPLSSDELEIINQGSGFIIETLSLKGTLMFLSMFISLGLAFLFLNKMPIVSLCLVIFAFVVALVCGLTGLGELDAIALKSKSEALEKSLKDLFKNLSDKNYEFRSEFIEDYSKLKIVVEANEYVSGTNSVVKAKPHSLTAYVVTTDSREALVKTMVSLVKEAEKRFKA